MPGPTRRTAERIGTALCAAVLAGAIGVLGYLRADTGGAGAATTSDAPASEPIWPDAPARPTRLLWDHTAYPDGRVLLAGGYVIEAGPRGVTVLNVRSGHERWRFRAPGLRIANPDRDVVASDGTLTLRLRTASGRVRTRTFDLGTGLAARPRPAVRSQHGVVRGRSDVGRPWTARPGRCPARSGPVSVGHTAGYVYAARRCGRTSMLSAIDRADGTLLWNRAVPGRALIAPADPHRALVYGAPPTGSPVGGVLRPWHVYLAAPGSCALSGTRLRCFSGRTGRVRWTVRVHPGTRIVTGDRTLFAYRVTGSAVRATVYRIGDGARILPAHRLPVPSPVHPAHLWAEYGSGVLVVGDDRHYAVYAG